MAQSFIQKVQTLISANLHGMVDKSLSNNSVAVFDQYIRDAEKNLDQLEQAMITVNSQAKTIRRKYEQFQREADKLDEQIDQLLELGKEDLAVAAQNEYNTKYDLAQEYRQQYLKQKQEADNLKESRLKLETRLRSIRREREHVIGLLELAKTKEIASRSMRSLEMLEGVDDSDISRVTEQIRARLDRADSEMELRGERLSNRLDQVLGQDQINQQLAERRRRLASEKARRDELLDDDALTMRDS